MVTDTESPTDIPSIAVINCTFAFANASAGRLFKAFLSQGTWKGTLIEMLHGR